ncbi:MAG: DUF362 domain-containing protein, partial [Planctomycetes bacterium]|nr:DUF362 domain-containing protein [Planctomycetota bacterium]
MERVAKHVALSPGDNPFEHQNRQQSPDGVNDDPFPITTSPEFCRAVINYIRACSDAKIIIAEGCGDAVLETDEVFRNLKYDRLARKMDVELLDLNHA